MGVSAVCPCSHWRTTLFSAGATSADHPYLSNGSLHRGTPDSYSRMARSVGRAAGSRYGKSTRTTRLQMCQRTERPQGQHRKFQRWRRSVDQYRTAVRRLCVVLDRKLLRAPPMPPVTADRQDNCTNRAVASPMERWARVCEWPRQSPRRVLGARLTRPLPWTGGAFRARKPVSKISRT
jgi:hypothetical protein